jgi:Cu/Zn superoxide dismutase
MKAYIVAAVLCAFALPASAQTVKFQGQMSGAQEVPAKQSNGTGNATATLNGNTLEYTVEYNGLSGPATAAHFHGPADAGANAGVVVPFANAASPIHGTATLNDQQKADLMAGKWYANVHTQQNPGGEIRGQMRRAQ